MFHAKTANPECLREAYEVGIVEPGTCHPPELGHLLPSDAPGPTVAKDQVYRGGPLPLCCLQFVDAHQESAVSAQGHDPAIRIGELRGNSPPGRAMPIAERPFEMMTVFGFIVRKNRPSQSL